MKYRYLFKAKVLNRFCDANLGIFLFQHFLNLIPFSTFMMIDGFKCSFAFIVLGFYVYAKFFPNVLYHLNSFSFAFAASPMQSCPSIVIFSIQFNAKVF
eukprot:01358.XXX_4193_4489_1 [CDS] Oithona nana genome sequencing.